jgi:NAD(P)-dependent dehydrogenase (short-subunit alcohol dehydrogenase family)
LSSVYDTNVVAPLVLMQLCLPDLAAAAGTIVNVSSDAAVEGYQGWGGYGSSKAALEQLSRVLAVERPEVRVYWIDPGDMNTRMHQDAYPGEDISDRPPPGASVPGIMRLVVERPPSGRYQVRSLAEST